MSRKKLLTGMAVLGIGVAIVIRLREQAAVQLPAYVPPPSPDPEPEDLQRLDDEAPPRTAPPADSLSRFFSDVMDDAPQGSHSR